MEENKFLKAARTARKENNVDDAKRYYETVKMDDPNNAEAKFFYEIYRLWASKQGEWHNIFISLRQVTPASIRLLSESEMPSSEKIELLTDMLNDIKTAASKLSRVLDEIGDPEAYKHRCTGVLALYEFGNAVEEYFPGDEDATKIAANAWIIAIHDQEWYDVEYGNTCSSVIGKTAPDEYAAKIQKYAPDWVYKKTPFWVKILSSIGVKVHLSNVSQGTLK